MNKSVFDVDERSGVITLAGLVDTSDTDRETYEERKENGPPTGLFWPLGEIPEDFIVSLFVMGDKDACGYFLGDKDEAGRALRRLLARYPEFRLTEGSL
jgi:hypothetical protein